MSDSLTPTRPGTADVPEQRSCTRCDGEQHLVSEVSGMGKYRCDTCEMVVGFDLDAEEPEFLISRGMPKRYTKDVFGDRVLPTERRLGSDGSATDELSGFADDASEA